MSHEEVSMQDFEAVLFNLFTNAKPLGCEYLFSARNRIVKAMIKAMKEAARQEQALI